MSAKNRLEKLLGAVAAGGFLFDRYFGPKEGQGNKPIEPQTNLSMHAPTVIVPKPDVDFDTYVGLPYKNSDILEIKKVSLGAIPASLENIVDLMEGRDHLFYVVLKDGNRLLAKPYKSSTEREALAELHGSDVSLSYVSQEADNKYFIEEVSKFPTMESALESHRMSLSQASGLFGEALYLVHHRGISDNKSYNNRVFVQISGRQVKVADFSHASIASNTNDFVSDMVRALFYIESLAVRHNITKKDLSEAIDSFSTNYTSRGDVAYRVGKFSAHEVRTGDVLVTAFDSIRDHHKDSLLAERH